MASSQILRWIDELNEVTDYDYQVKRLKREIKQLSKEPSSRLIKKKMKEKCDALDELLFQPDYMFLVINRKDDYRRACKGFSINGVKYKRLVGTNGGIKNSTIVFVSERLSDVLRCRIDNNRDMSKKLVTAKLEAYKALVCSASNPVSAPHGVLVVDDVETEFLSDIIYLTDEADGEPAMEFRKDEPIKMDASDGYGLISPTLAQRWSEDLQLDYLISGGCLRYAFTKGMVFTFDFVDFAEKVAGKYIVKDAWGNEVDIRDVELILTTSMLKLWDSYESCEDFFEKSTGNNYSFALTKVCPKVLESERRTNYQFIQPYNLSDEDIEELISPTIKEIHDVIRGDWRKTVLYLKGVGLNEDNVERLDDDFVKAIMIDQRVLDDPFIQSQVYKFIRNNINEAKVGVIKIHGNYSIVSGDPYLLCQNIFDLELTGLLKSGEVYNKYWVDYGSDKLACFRAPMSCANNIRIVSVSQSEEAQYWYKYMNTCTILNGWDTITAALNGCDFDGDLVMLTDNKVLVEKAEELPALMCVQRKAVPIIPTEEDFIKSNISSFGNQIGEITNHVTSMFSVRSRFDMESEEYKELTYRIQCGQLYQQNQYGFTFTVRCSQKDLLNCWKP